MRIRKKTIIIIGIAISYLAIFWGVVLAISRATNIQSYISQPHYAINYDEPFPVEKMEFPNAFQDKEIVFLSEDKKQAFYFHPRIGNLSDGSFDGICMIKNLPVATTFDFYHGSIKITDKTNKSLFLEGSFEGYAYDDGQKKLHIKVLSSNLDEYSPDTYILYTIY